VKKFILIFTVVFFSGWGAGLCAGESSLTGFSQSWTLHELAASESIPVKQLARELELDLTTSRDRSFSELGVSRQNAEDALNRYREAEPGMVSSIVLVGMLIVFASLVVVSFFISLFRHLHLFEKITARRKSESVDTAIGTISSRGDLSEKALAAVVTAIFLHEDEVDSENRLLLTWKRVSGRGWKTGEEMPNALHFAARRGRK